MRCPGEGSLSATMRKREGVQPRNDQRSNETRVFIYLKSDLYHALKVRVIQRGGV